MIKQIAIFLFLIGLTGCTPKPMVISPKMPETYVASSSYETLDGWSNERIEEVMGLFLKNCQAQKAVELYGTLCEEALQSPDARKFFESSLQPYKIESRSPEASALLTGYYEPLLHGSYIKSERYRYPLYAVPDDLITVKLDTLYPELKGMRLRGKVVGNTLLPYPSRTQMEDHDAEVICWVDDRVALFFLEVQGSGRIQLDNNETIYVGYANQNGHPYRSIGKYLVASGEIAEEEISLQSIRQWFKEHPGRVEEVLNHNPSHVFFEKRNRSATGSLGLPLTPKRSIAVDQHYVPLGAMLFLHSQDPLSGEPIRQTVFAQDTGGAIKGEVRADFFWGFGAEAETKAGKMQEALELWVFMPKAE